MYKFEICKQISQSNINFEENIFVLTVLSYRKIRLDEKRSLHLEFSHFCELIFITEADKSVYKLLKWNCSNISIDTITWIWFRLAGTSCSADLHLIICSRIFRILSRFQKRFKYWKKKILIYDEKMHKLLWWISKWCLNEKGTWHEILTQIGDAKCPVRKQH